LGVTIETLAAQSTDVLPLIREIFFLSADPKNVSEDPVKNEAFFEKWTGYYLKNAPEWVLLAFGKSKLLGYLMCGTDSSKALHHFQSRNPSYGLFADLFEKFPAHLHINCHPDARGKGVGGLLIEDMVNRLTTSEIPGVHLITSPSQRNVSFYRKNGFTHEVQREWKGYPLLFMGRSLQL
jgi:ribosomal protein S18 acetylase RimI-like enzyme